MMKYILAILFIFLFCYGFLRPFSSLYSKLFLIIGSFLALLSVLGENYTMYLANLLGVGRSADLYLYLGLVTTFLFILYTINKFKNQERKISTLIQKISLIDAQNKKKNK